MITGNLLLLLLSSPLSPHIMQSLMIPLCARNTLAV